jgi:hypothetical protein
MKLCKDCWKPRDHENALISRCKACQYLKSEKNVKQTRIKTVSNKKRERLKNWWEKKIFIEIWNEREHNCEICNKKILEAQTFCFAHKCPKWTYPEHRLKKENISLVCSIKCHWEVDKMFSWIKRAELNLILKNNIELINKKF